MRVRHDGAWVIRIEDLDPPRTVAGAAAHIVETLARCGLESDEPVVFQSTRSALYEAAFARAAVSWIGLRLHVFAQGR